MALQFQQPNIPMPPSKYGELNRTLGSTMENLPNLIVQYMELKKKRENENFLTNLRKQEYEKEYGTGEPLTGTETSQEEMGKLGIKGYSVQSLGESRKAKVEKEAALDKPLSNEMSDSIWRSVGEDPKKMYVLTPR